MLISVSFKLRCIQKVKIYGHAVFLFHVSVIHISKRVYSSTVIFPLSIKMQIISVNYSAWEIYNCRRPSDNF